MTTKAIFRFGAIAAILLIAGIAVAKLSGKEMKDDHEVKQTTNGFAIVELFTSEGCSSCPRADIILGDIAKEYPEQVMVLGFHVDYWNRLGWRDPFSDAVYSKRQNNYNATKQADGVYTPQAIINGTTHVVGSEEDKIKRALDYEIAHNVNQPIKISSSLSPNKHVLDVYYQFEGKPGEVLNIALLQKNASTDVKAGENSGRKLVHVNIVRDFRTVAGRSGTVHIAIPPELSPEACSVVAYVQKNGTMEIKGATRLNTIQ